MTVDRADYEALIAENDRLREELARIGDEPTWLDDELVEESSRMAVKLLRAEEIPPPMLIAARMLSLVAEIRRLRSHPPPTGHTGDAAEPGR
jgi:hypothetical protein